LIEIPLVLVPNLTRLEKITLNFCEGLLPATYAKEIALRILNGRALTEEEYQAINKIADSYKQIVYEDATITNDDLDN
jgi:hypothetical protein